MKKNNCLLLLITALMFLISTCAKNGETGPQGPQGPIGPIGPQGPPGVNGTMIYSGDAAPSASTGVKGDFYIDLATDVLYGPKTDSGWGTGISLAGAPGKNGTNGTNGKNGTIIYSGNTPPPASTGTTGDFYIDLQTGIFYGPKTITGWPTNGILLGGNSGDLLGITTFTLNNYTPAVAGKISGDSITFSLPIKPGQDPGLIKPGIAFTKNAKFSPDTSIAQDFSTAVTYKVTAANGASMTYYAKATPPFNLKGKPTAPSALCLYYGYPSLVNGSNYDLDKAARVFAKFDVIVFGDHIYETSHGDHNNTIGIIARIKALKSGVKIFGYIDVGKSENLSSDKLYAAIDSWKAMGADGVFGDEFGTANGSPRSRQNMFIDYAHGKSMFVFANDSGVEDILGDYNGSPTHLKSGDYYLLENVLVSNGTINSLSSFYARANAAYFYMRTKNVSIAVSSSIPFANLNSSSNNTDAFKYSWCGTTMYGFDTFQFTDYDFSANSASGSNNVLYFFPNLFSTFGSYWKEFDWIKIDSPAKYERSTDLKTISITSDGKGQVTP
ncbi:MAG TPA: hypothetical protein VHA56_00775 [Mucilaginibacter sp.]|nr:hypothetical protein [Mucilaginibacter sp.]